MHLNRQRSASPCLQKHVISPPRYGQNILGVAQPEIFQFAPPKRRTEINWFGVPDPFYFTLAVKYFSAPPTPGYFSAKGVGMESLRPNWPLGTQGPNQTDLKP